MISLPPLPRARYKPDCLHTFLYPTVKDSLGKPVFTMGEGGEKHFITCSKGIEVFRNGSGPGGAPALAAFPGKPAERKQQPKNNDKSQGGEPKGKRTKVP